jgi:hypothetical protein
MALFGGASHLKPGGSGGSSGGKMSADLPKPKSYSVAQPFSYGSAYQYKGVDYTIVNAESQYATMGLPGVAIIKAFKRIIRSTDTLAMKVEGLWMVFVEKSRDLDWKWYPTTACSVPDLLDAKKTQAECGTFAAGFLCLATTKAPFGLGIDPGTVTYVEYQGEKAGDAKPGLIAFHPRNGCLGLLPNVYTPVGAVLDENLNGHCFYHWGNHKVVEYGDKVYDPTYGVQYAHKEDMAAMDIVGWEVLGGGKVDMDAFFNAAKTDNVGKCLLHAKTKADRIYDFRATPLHLRAGVTMRWDGPFTKNQRDWLAEKLASSEAVSSDAPFEAPQ